MFVSFLYPFRLRGRLAPYLWVAYKQMTDLPPDEVSFIASEDYFADPAVFRAQGRFECSWPENQELGFRVPSRETAGSYDSYAVPGSIYRRLKEEHISDSLVWRHLIKHVDDELVACILAAADQIAETARVEALLTWCNFASLSEAGRRLGVPVIHNELGPLRFPWYRPLGYFDFSGVNGDTEAERRFRAAAGQADWRHLDRDQLVALLARKEAGFDPAAEPDYDLGVPLQVEDDSNVVAYGRGFDLALVLQYALEEFSADRVLIRPHPAARFFRNPGGLNLDASATSMAFVQRCRRILTLNSSVAVEAMLAGKAAVILGESPARLAAVTSLSKPRPTSGAELDFLLLNYFVPYELIFDASYFRWRLGGPPEGAIRRRHLEILGA